MRYFMAVLMMFFLIIIPFYSCSNHDKEVFSDIYHVQRRNMVRWQIADRGIKSPALLEAISEVPRHLFLSPSFREKAYLDEDIPITQTIGQHITTPRPFVVAKTIDVLNLKGGEKVLEIGTGLGYQSALLGELARKVYTIEIVPEIAKQAQHILKQLHYRNVHSRIGDGYKGWPEEAPFDAILVMASATEVPDPLLDQLSVGGRLVMPIGEGQEQSLVVYKKYQSGIKKESVMPVKLKPLEGVAARKALR